MRTLTRRLLVLVPQARYGVAAVALLLLAVTGTYVAQGVLVARAIGAVLERDGGGLAGVVAPLAGVAVLQLARAVLLAWRDALALPVSGRVKEALREQLTTRLLQLGPGWAQRHRTGSVQSTLADGLETLDPLVGRFMPQVVATVVGAAAVSALLVTLDAVVGLIVVACVLVVAAAPWLSDRYLRPRTMGWWHGYKRLHAEHVDALQGMATLKVFNAAGRRGAALQKLAEAFARDSIRMMAVAVAYVGVVGLVVAVGTGLVLGIGAVRMAGGGLATAELLTILILARECFRPLTDLQNAYHGSYAAVATAPGIWELLDAPPETPERSHPRPAPGGARPPGIRFDDVTFSYRGPDGPPALDGFTLDVRPGERVALVGRSGAGKTTVVSLLLRWYDPQHGRILLTGVGSDGDHRDVDVRDLRLPDLRAQIALVSQDTYLFHGTIRHNLALARPDATGAELEAAARAARAHEFITAFPQGYDTVVGERGLKLSGGERQRIAIARALLADRPILVLDEATSSVDAANEAGIQQALDALAAGRTTLVIAHRLSTVRNADRVVVLEGGRTVEAGAPAELLGRDGAYARMLAVQTGATEGAA